MGDILFKPIAVRQLRLEVDDSAYRGQPDRHFWLTGVEAYSAVQPNNG